MISTQDLAGELSDLGQAIGLISNGGIDSSWFEDPQQKLSTILSDPQQRQGLINLMNALLPPATVPGIPDHETWHPLLGSQPRGNVYFTINTSGPGVVFGVAADFGNLGSPGITADVQVSLPLVSANGGVQAIAGTAAGPLRIAVQAQLGLQKPPIRLDGISIVASIAPPSVSLTVTLENLDLGDGSAQNVVLNPEQLASEAFHVILGLLKQELASLAGAVASHLLGALGLAGDGVPQFPFLSLATDPSAIQNWFSSLVQGAAVSTWLAHVAGLIGATDLTVKNGGGNGPWTVTLIPFDAQSSLDLVISLAGESLQVGVAATLFPGGASGPGRVQASGVIASITLSGTGNASVLPSASIAFVAPGNTSAQLLSTGPLTVSSFSTGLQWTGSALQPLVLLSNVNFNGTTYDHLDLTNADSVGKAASNAVQTAISQALGSSAGSNLMALAGLSNILAAHSVDLTALVGNPARAIGAFHRGVLLDGQSWSTMLSQIAGLLGLPTATSGTGTPNDPWLAPIASSGPLTLNLAAWNAQASGVATDAQKLRLGLRAVAVSAPLSVSLTSELLGFDLPENGAGTASLFAGQHVALLIKPGVAAPAVAGFALTADSFSAQADWSPSASFSWQAQIHNLSITSGANTIGPLSLAFPISGFDASNPPNTAQALGINVAQLETLLRMLIARAASEWGGVPAYTIAALLGVHSGLPGLQSDWPVLADATGPGSLISDPVSALKQWLSQVATGVSSDGTPFFLQLLNWLQLLLSNTLPTSLPALAAHAAAAPPNFPFSGTGTYEDPWSLPLLTASDAVDALAWLEPAGLPASWATALSSAANAAADFPALLTVIQALAPFIPGLADATKDLDLTQAATGLKNLATFLSSSDGVVPLSAQVPTGGTWTAGTNIQAAHPLETQDASAIAQISAQIDTIAGGAASPRAVLLLGPAFGDHTTWQTFLGAKPTANFSFRVPNTNPAAIDLSTVTAAVDYYTCDLNDDGTGNLTSLSAQIGLAVARIGELRQSQKVTLVAHSTAGVAARVFAHDNPSLVQGLITLGTPHLGSPLPFFTDPLISSVVRLLQPLASGIAAGPMLDTFNHYFSALDGYLPAAKAGDLPTPSPYPTGSFSGTPTTDTAGVPAFAIGSALAGTLQQAVAAAVAALATKAGGAGGTAPTHLSFGARARLGLPSSAKSSVAANAYLRGGLFRIPLQSGAAQPPRPAQFLSVDAELSRPGDWLAGEPGLGTARVRSVEFGVDMHADGAGGLSTNPRIVLHQASLNAPMLPRIDLAGSAATAQALLGAIVKAVSTPPPPAASSISSLLAALGALGLTVTNSDGSMGLSTDAVAAIMLDPASFFAPRIASALSASGLAGFTGSGKGPWTFPIPGLPLTAYIQQGSLSVGLKTSPSLPLGSNASLGFDVSVLLPAFTPSVTATLTVGGFVLTYANGQLVAQAPPWLPATTIVPLPPPATLIALLNNVLPRVLVSGATTALIGAAIPPGSPAATILTDLFGSNFFQIPPDALFSNTAQYLSSASALGLSGGTGLDPAKLSQLLKDINQQAGFPAGAGLTLPGGFLVTAAGSGTAADPTRLQLSTTAPVGGVLGAQLSLSLDQTLHVTPGGTISLTTPLNGGTWTSATINFGLASGQLTLSIAPQNQSPIQILPTFSGLGALASGLTALLPAVLDQLVSSLNTPGPSPAWLSPGLQMAQAVGVYDTVGGFAAHADTLKTLLQTNWLNLFSPSNRAAVATAAANMVNALGVSPAVSASGSSLTWSFPLSGADAGTISLSAGWDDKGPLATIAANSVKLGGGAVALTLSAGYAAGAIECAAGLGLDLPTSLGINATPQFNLGVSTTGGAVAFTAQFFPLAGTGGNGPLEIDLAPQVKVVAGSQTPLQLLENWALPLAANVAIKAANAQLNNPLWTGATVTLNSLLTSAGILNGGVLKTPLPDVVSMATGALAGLAGAGISVSLSSTLKLGIVNDSGKIGLRLSGSQPFDIGSYSLAALFGAPSSWTTLSPGADAGLDLYLFTNSSGSFTFTPELHCAGVGLGLAGANDAPLVNLSQFRMGGFNGYFFFDATFSGGLNFSNLGGGLELVQLGIPLGLATGAGGNPVATSLLQSGGAPGDSHPVNPGVDVSAWYWSKAGDAQFHIQFGGQTGVLWIGIHSGFGPIYIDQLGLNVDSTKVNLLIDGSVKINGLTADADALTVGIPYKSITNPGDWTLDLGGLALGFSAPGITIAGGLYKNPGPPAEYDGLLLIQITQFGFIAVGAYSTPTDLATNETYTSLFIFAGVFIVIGLPPIINITGLGLGVGYNRELLPPKDVGQLPKFLLVEALDNPGAIANDPMGALKRLGTQVPAKRGSLWFAAGVHGNSFVVVNVTAVLYVALDSGVTIGILGIARMALPSDDTALVSIEMALECIFSPTSGTLFLLAQLTDNSWLLNKDCQLTGGFGYYMCFPDSQFVVTMGGYHPAFQPDPKFPNPPRLGYHWSFLGVVAIKGESYFALTNSAVMAGARMEATYGPDWINVWFTAYTDFLLSWDPFFYNISAGISLGATFKIHICFFACVDIDISVSIGATLQVQGPPLNGTVTVNLLVGSVTVSFGPDPNPNKNPIDWPSFATKYLQSGDTSQTAVDTHVLTGLLPPSPSGAQPTPGTQSQPWAMTTEFSFQTETRMPATSYIDFFGNNSGSLPVHNIDLAPMGNHAITTTHKITLEGQSGNGWNVITAGGPGEFTANPAQFTFAPVIGQVSQATYQYIDHDGIPAGAQTLPALLGIIFTGTSLLQNPSSQIPISTLVDSGDSRPLPFATWTLVLIGNLQTFGAAADNMAAVTAGVTTLSDLNASVSLLQGGGLFSQARIASGLPAQGLRPMAARALQSFSSSGPLITPITTGLTMKPVGLALPPIINRVVPLKPVPLLAFRLRAVFQTRPLPAADAPPAFRTTVNFLAANPARVAAAAGPAIGRFTPPVPAPLPGARLSYLRETAAPRPTSLARSGRTLRSPELGWSAGAAHVQAFQNAEASITANGVPIPAGTIHIWEFPASNNTINVAGTAGVRLTFLSPSGRVIADLEESGNAQSSFTSPAGSAAVVITCLGNTTSVVSGGMGAVTLLAAAQNRKPVVGWQAGNLMAQINSSTFLARGSCVMLAQPNLVQKNKQVTAQGMLRLSQAVLDQPGVETWLPASIGVIGLILDQQDPTAAGDGDLAIALSGATLASSPARVVGGARKILLYDVTQVTTTDHIVIAVASRSASRLSGIIGLAGHAQEWAALWNGAIPEHIVPDGPLTPDGSVTVTITAVAPAPAAGAAA